MQNAVAKLDVDEEAAVGTSIGDPVSATDADNDPLLYGLADTPDLKIGADGAARFTIDPESGQIKVGVRLDNDAADGSRDEDTPAQTDPALDANTLDNDEYVLRVTATDPSGASATINVVVTVNDVDEAPTFDGTDGGATNPSTLEVEEAVAGVAASGEIASGNIYDADDPEGGTVTYTLEGPDAAKFEIETGGALSFVDSGDRAGVEEFRPNYESPADDNKDNVYEVTVVATAAVGGDESPSLGRKAVKVTVTNAEDPGTVTLSQRQPYVGSILVATLNDQDGGVSGTTWKWYRGSHRSDWHVTYGRVWRRGA